MREILGSVERGLVRPKTQYLQQDVGVVAEWLQNWRQVATSEASIFRRRRCLR